MFFFIQSVTLDSVIADIVETVKEGLEWGSTVAIGVTASLLAISLIRFLFSR